MRQRGHAWLGTSAALAAVMLIGAAGPAAAAINYNASKSNTGNRTASCRTGGPAAHGCPTGRRTHAKTYNASHSNTASVAGGGAPPHRPAMGAIKSEPNGTGVRFVGHPNCPPHC